MHMELALAVLVCVVFVYTASQSCCRGPRVRGASPRPRDAFSSVVAERRVAAVDRRPTLRRVRAVGVELARGRALHAALHSHVLPRHASPGAAALGDARSTFVDVPHATLAHWVRGTLRAPDRVAGDAADSRRVCFYRDWGNAVVGEGQLSVVKVVVHMHAASGAGSRPRVVTAYPTRALQGRRDVVLSEADDDDGGGSGR